MKRRTIVLISISILFAVIFFIMFGPGLASLISTAQDATLTDSEIKRRTAISNLEYPALFNDTFRLKIKNTSTEVPSAHFPYCYFIYDNAINLWIHKVEQMYETPLDSFVTLINAPNNRTEGCVYKGTHLSRIEMGFTPVGDSVFESLEIIYSGKQLERSTMGDSVLFFSFDMKNLSFRENPRMANYFVFGARPLNAFKETDPRTKLYLTLLKRNKSIYIIAAYSGTRDPDTSMIKNMLH